MENPNQNNNPVMCLLGRHPAAVTLLTLLVVFEFTDMNTTMTLGLVVVPILLALGSVWRPKE